MNINNLTIKSQEALQQAQQIAQSFGQQQLENEHIFKGILEVDENVTSFILKKLNVNVDLFKKILDSTIQSFPKVSGGEIMLSREEKQSVSKVGWRPLTDLGQLNEIIDLSTEKPVLIFKHSTRCSIIAKKMNDEFLLKTKE